MIPTTKLGDRHHNLSNIRKRQLVPRVWITRLDDWDHILLHNVKARTQCNFLIHESKHRTVATAVIPVTNADSGIVFTTMLLQNPDSCFYNTT